MIADQRLGHWSLSWLRDSKSGVHMREQEISLHSDLHDAHTPAAPIVSDRESVEGD